MNTQDLSRCYQVLEIDERTLYVEIKLAYRDLVKIWHPDRFAHDVRLQEKCEKRTRDINYAYRQLNAYFKLSSSIENKPVQNAASNPMPAGRAGETLVLKPGMPEGPLGIRDRSWKAYYRSAIR
jgi:DnaJ domain